MDGLASAIWLMAGGYGAGACLAILAPSDRAARVVTALGGVVGSVGGLAAAAIVLATGRPLEIALPHLVAAAGGVDVHVDLLGALFLALVAAVGLFAAIYGVAYTADYDGRRSLRAFGVMFNGFLLGMSLVPCAGNVFTFLLAWELMTLTAAALVATEHESRDSRRAALLYLVMSHVATGCLIAAFLMAAAAAGTLSFDGLFSGRLVAAPRRDLLFVLFFAGFAVKAGVIPLHVWLPEAHPAAPSSISAVMSAVR